MYYRVIFSDDYLAHHGILGMRWGIRRYQNKDGSLTSAGKRRRALDITDLDNPANGDRAAAKAAAKAYRKQKRKDTFDYWTTKNEKNGKDKPKISPAQSVVKDVGSVIEETKGIKKSLDKRATIESYKRAEELSDEEIKARINRMNLERQYVSLETERINAGRVTAEDILTAVGSVVAITGAAVGVVGTVRGMRNARTNKEDDD